MKISSWGGVKETSVTLLNRFKPSSKKILISGSRLSYGDSCLNHNGDHYNNKSNDLLINFSPENKTIKVETGITFEALLEFLVPRGFFLPVTPGTKFITVGGAISNDIHGKNHHVDGNFGHWVEEFTLLRSNGEILQCSHQKNSEMFKATIGGLGLTGFIKDCTFKLVPITSSYIDTETIKFHSLKEFLQINSESQSFKYTVSWVDCISSSTEGKLKGHYIRGNHASTGGLTPHKRASWKTIPIFFPSWSLNSISVFLFNLLYFNRLFSKKTIKKVHYDPFFYPLDSINSWNKIYGKNGLYQFQCVLPMDVAEEGLLEILKVIKQSGQGSFLSVLKTFGNISSLGMMSFPKEGITLALDFPNRGDKTKDLLQNLYDIVLGYNGRIYPAKDQLLTRVQVEKMYPELKTFTTYKDKLFESDWWKRITE